VPAREGEKPDASRLLIKDAVGCDTNRFLDMRELEPTCGPLVLQFPYFNRAAFKTLDDSLERLDPFLAALPKGFRYGVEIRNNNWPEPELTAALKQHQAALLLVDIAYMPHPADLALDLVTADFIYARLIGDRKAIEAKTKTFDKIVVDQSSRHVRWAELLDELIPQVHDTFVYPNNYYAGHGPETIRELAERVGQ
jgi:uncharacterized protein YecE (DUF72 family)